LKVQVSIAFSVYFSSSRGAVVSIVITREKGKLFGTDISRFYTQ